MHKLKRFFIACCFASPSAFACQNPIGSWKSSEQGDEFLMNMRTDHTGTLTYLEANEKVVEPFTWRFLTEKRRPESKEHGFSFETNVIELVFPTANGDSQTNTIEYLLCTGDHMIGQVQGYDFDLTVYQYVKIP